MEATIGFLGFGTMGSSIARGLIASGYSPSRMQWYNPTERMAERARDLGLPARTSSAEYLIAESDVVILGMKPQQAAMSLLPVQAAFRPGHIVVSLLAGLRISDLASHFPDGVALVRVMPNTPVALGKGVLGAALGKQLAPAGRSLLTRLSLLEAPILFLKILVMLPIITKILRCIVDPQPLDRHLLVAWAAERNMYQGLCIILTLFTIVLRGTILPILLHIMMASRGAI